MQTKPSNDKKTETERVKETNSNPHKPTEDSKTRQAKSKEKRFGNGTRDLVDEASYESFPASDPPGY